MGRYSVVIIPQSDNRDGEICSVPRLTIGISSDGLEPRVTDVAINTTSPTGLTAESIIDIDVPAIVTALANRFPGAVLPSQWEDRFDSRPLEQTVSDEARPTEIDASDHVATETSASSESGRVYRKMPDSGELLAIYQKAGTVIGVAKHYGVPRHTAQGWMGRLRKLEQRREADASGTKDRPSPERTQ
ncbi:hypothetical protein AB0F85_31940 [Nocardia fluminea]|uniref:hypothetical protein n=1 Tax=Nocardia fluminea TaxID=134984 RepID=UPI0033C4BF04